MPLSTTSKHFWARKEKVARTLNSYMRMNDRREGREMEGTWKGVRVYSPFPVDTNEMLRTVFLSCIWIMILNLLMLEAVLPAINSSFLPLDARNFSDPI